jgi:DNA repair exonuclease SbcCD ATPase subunit
MDEVNRAIITDPDYLEIEKQIQEINKQIADLDSLMISAAKKYDRKNQENQTKQNRIYELQQKIRGLQFNDRSNAEKNIIDLKLKRDDLQNDIRLQDQNIISLQNIIRTEENGIRSLTDENDKLRKDWTKINEKIISIADDEFICPTCKRQFETDDIEARKAEMISNFNNDKIARLARISEKGTGNKAEIDRLRIEILRVKKSIEIADGIITKNRKELAKIAIPEATTIQSDQQINVLQDQITEIEKIIEPLKAVDNTELLMKKQVHNSDLTELNGKLKIREFNADRRIRISELEDQQKSLAQQIANLEKQEFQCEKFIRAKVKMIEEKVNGLFSFVRFKMFNSQINGGLEECCDSLIKGVPFADANNGAKINAGIDIINAFSKHYDVYAPIFTDNAEAVNKLLKTESQMIKLFVTTDKELKVVNN